MRTDSEAWDTVTRTTSVEFLSIRSRLLHVVRLEDVTPRMRRVVLAGEDLNDGFPFTRFAATDHVKLFFPHPETGQIVYPEITDKGLKFPEGAPDPIFRDYTVRAYDSDRHELTIDFVIHDHGVAGRWARDARVGDLLGVAGPRAHKHLPVDFKHYVVAGDETALPAIGRIIEEAPEGARVTAIIEVDDEDGRQILHGVAPSDIRWIIHDPLVPDGLSRAMKDLNLSPDPDVFIVVAGEANSLRPIRRYLRRELGFSQEQLDISGYWKKGDSNFDHHAVDNED